MRKIFISAGHSVVPGKDRGAEAIYKKETIYEGVLAYNVAESVYKKLLALGANVYLDNKSNVLSETIKALRSLVGKEDIAVEYHFNAANKKATGTETIVPDQSSELEKHLADRITFVASNVLGIKNRGVKPESDTARKRLGWMRQSCETILHEICFIDNPKDVDAFVANFEALTDAYAQQLFNYSKI